MSPDPLGVRATSNLYGYVLGKPTVFIDPRGLYVDLNIFNRKQDAVAWDVAENFMPNLNADGYFTVAGHGNLTGAGNAVRDENLKWLSAKDLARRIKKSPRKCPKVFLFACNAGRLSYAQTLADELGAEVRAPNGWIRFWREYRPWGVSPDPGVNYVTFKPKK